jgi:hypothetical protein
MSGITGNQDKKTLNVPSNNPEMIPAEVSTGPPDSTTFDAPLKTFEAKKNKKM